MKADVKSKCVCQPARPFKAQRTLLDYKINDDGFAHERSAKNKQREIFLRKLYLDDCIDVSMWMIKRLNDDEDRRAKNLF